ncbi:MBL fold metallo-hydrolase, partial [Candidatus Bathyarchaeota archaeon]
MDRWLLLISLILLLTLIVVAWKLVMKPREVEEVGEGETAKGPPALSLKACRGELVILYDNNPYDPRLETSWGFSCLLTLNETTILFDTGGDGRLLLRNMEKLGVDPREIDIIVLSHIHGDHVGGLDEVLEADGDAVVYLPASFPESFKGWVRDLAREVVEVEGPTVICGCAASTGPMRGGGVDEEALIINTPKGLVVVTGCAHPGVVR